MSNECYSYDPATDYDDDQVHYHEERPVNPDPRFESATKDKKEKDKRGFFSRLFSSKGKESGTPSLKKQFSQKTPNKTSAPKQRSHSAPRMMKSNSWQNEQPVSEQEKQHWKLLQQQAQQVQQPTQKPSDRRSATPDMPQRRGSFDFNPIEDEKNATPNSFYGSSFHQSMDDYHSPSTHERGLFVNGGANDNAPQPYYLQSYNQLMHQRHVQHTHHEIPKQHPPHFQQPQQKQQNHQQQHQQHPYIGASQQNGQRPHSQQNSGRSTPVDGHMSRSNSNDILPDPGLEDPAIQAFMEKRRLKKERSREDKLIKEMLVEASLLGVSPSKLISSDASTVLEEKSTTFPTTGVIHQEIGPHHPAPSKRPSQTGHIGELGTKSTDSYDDAQHIQRQSQPHSKRNSKVEPSIQSSSVTPSTQLEKAKIPASQTTPVSLTGSGIVQNTTPTSTVAASETAPSHPLHDFSGIPKGVNFDPLHVMHVDNAEILKIAAALLQKARRHPQLPRTDGIPREVAAAQLATMWLNQATFVRRKAGPTDKTASQKTSSSTNKANMAHIPKVPFPKPEFKQSVTKTEEPSSSVALDKKPPLISSKIPDVPPAAKTRSASNDVAPHTASTKQASQSIPIPIPIPAATNNDPPNYDPYNHYEQAAPRYQMPVSQSPPQMSASYDYHASSSHREFSADMSSGFNVPTQNNYVDSPGSAQRGGRKIIRVPIEEPSGRRQSPMVAPDYARDRSVSEGFLDNNLRPVSGPRQSSANPPPPSLMQQMSKRGFQQQQQQQLPAPPLRMGYSSDPYDYDYDYDAPYPVQTHQAPVNYPPPPLNNAANHPHYAHHPPAPAMYEQEYISDLDDEEDSYGDGYEENEYMERELYGGGNGRVPSGPPPTYSQSFNAPPLQQMIPPVPVISGWTCKFCTLINDAASSRCSACEAPRTKGPLIV